MFTQITQGVKVSVETFYRDDHSNPFEGEYTFAYRIIIENNSDKTIQLLRRHWFIVDANGMYKEVEGEGVVGQQPIIEPDGVHQYVSGCHLKTEIGKMYGSYLMKRHDDWSLFKVDIPEFVMVAPVKMN
ncbi:MAG: Co2+/Mg2+ efflux protein ApaG [Bacteroidetes bacterium]|nr:Co2+/Mg2+ efflux protein ApaG [Bacteroidota bacterium]